jgi:uncharacterized membrane protein
VILHRFRNSALPVNYVLLLAVLGLVAGFVGVREILGDLRDDVFNRYDTASIIYALITWAGSILMLVGAVQLWLTAKNG